MEKTPADCQLPGLLKEIFSIIEDDLNLAAADTRMKVIAEGSIARFCRALRALDPKKLSPACRECLRNELGRLRAKVPRGSRHLEGHFNETMTLFSS